LSHFDTFPSGDYAEYRSVSGSLFFFVAQSYDCGSVGFVVCCCLEVALVFPQERDGFLLPAFVEFPHVAAFTVCGKMKLTQTKGAKPCQDNR